MTDVSDNGEVWSCKLRWLNLASFVC